MTPYEKLDEQARWEAFKELQRLNHAPFVKIRDCHYVFTNPINPPSPELLLAAARRLQRAAQDIQAHTEWILSRGEAA